MVKWWSVPLFLPSDAACGRQDFISESVKLTQTTSGLPWFGVSCRDGPRQRVTPERNFNLSFFENNAQCFWC